MNFFTDPDLQPWLIPIGPLLAFLIITLATNRAKLTPSGDMVYGGFRPPYGNMPIPVATNWSRILSISVGMGGIIMSLLVSWSMVFRAIGDHDFGSKIFGENIPWLATGNTMLRVGVMVDPLNATLLFMVPLAVLCIFIYSIGYMAADPRQSRFFALISLFAGAMLTLTVSDNLLFLFVGWEVMGLCSYLLIGFWFEKESAYKAAIKAFTTTRVADVIMLLGIVYLYHVTGTLNFREIMYDNNGAMLELLGNTPAILFGSFGFSAASLIGVFLIIGTIGKSAQFPLHVWLPDAMQGPTPVSAMIHAAAMVSAGIYAIIRMYPVFVGAGAFAADPHHGIFTQPLMLMALVGGFTALFAATMAVAQNDVKAVLAYSTISQLGFMMAALGIGAYVAATFHLITHAFFKALLFMASGSVIHAMEHGEHHVHEHAHGDGHRHDDHAPTHANTHEHGAQDHSEAVDVHDHTAEHGHAGHAEHGHGEEHAGVDPHAFDPQDMMNMGGLRHKIPVTFYAFMIGGFSLAGVPLITAGFWSKDEILADAWLGATEGFGPHAFVFVMLAIAAFLTAFYTMRQLSLTFFGEARTEAAAHAGLGGPMNIVSQTMQLPLIILAFFAIVAGFAGVPQDFPIFGSIFSSEGSFFFHLVEKSVVPLANIAPQHPAFNIFPVLVSSAVALGGLYLGWVMYGRKPLKAGEPDPLVAILGPSLHQTLSNRYYMDDLYTLVFVKPSQAVANFVNVFIDKGVIDGILHGIARVFTWLGDFIKVLNLWLIDGVSDGIPHGIYKVGGWLRGTQTGRIQQYLLAVLIVAVLIGIVLAVSSGALAAPR